MQGNYSSSHISACSSFRADEHAWRLYRGVQAAPLPTRLAEPPDSLDEILVQHPHLPAGLLIALCDCAKHRVIALPDGAEYRLIALAHRPDHLVVHRLGGR